MIPAEKYYLPPEPLLVNRLVFLAKISFSSSPFFLHISNLKLTAVKMIRTKCEISTSLFEKGSGQ